MRGLGGFRNAHGTVEETDAAEERRAYEQALSAGKKAAKAMNRIPKGKRPLLPNVVARIYRERESLRDSGFVPDYEESSDRVSDLTP